MTSKATMLVARTTAGARYLAAVIELRAAMVDLAALDLALQNANYGVGTGNGGIASGLSFTGDFREIPQGARHPVYAPQDRGGIDKDVAAQEQIYLAALKAG